MEKFIIIGIFSLAGLLPLGSRHAATSLPTHGGRPVIKADPNPPSPDRMGGGTHAENRPILYVSNH